MTDDTEIEVENYEEVVGDFYYNSPQPTVRTPIVDGSQQPTPNQNSYDGSARSTPRLVHASSAGNLRDRRPESVTLAPEPGAGNFVPRSPDTRKQTNTTQEMSPSHSRPASWISSIAAGMGTLRNMFRRSPVSNTETSNQQTEDRINSPQPIQRETVSDLPNTVSPTVRFRENRGRPVESGSFVEFRGHDNESHCVPPVVNSGSNTRVTTVTQQRPSHSVRVNGDVYDDELKVPVHTEEIFPRRVRMGTEYGEQSRNEHDRYDARRQMNRRDSLSPCVARRRMPSQFHERERSHKDRVYRAMTPKAAHHRNNQTDRKPLERTKYCFNRRSSSSDYDSNGEARKPLRLSHSRHSRGYNKYHVQQSVDSSDSNNDDDFDDRRHRQRDRKPRRSQRRNSPSPGSKEDDSGDDKSWFTQRQFSRCRKR